MPGREKSTAKHKGAKKILTRRALGASQVPAASAASKAAAPCRSMKFRKAVPLLLASSALPQAATSRVVA
jgi:hypothetical protein